MGRWDDSASKRLCTARAQVRSGVHLRRSENFKKPLAGLVLGLATITGCEDARFQRDVTKITAALSDPSKQVRAARKALEQKSAETASGPATDGKMLAMLYLASDVGKTLESARKAVATLPLEANTAEQSLVRHLNQRLDASARACGRVEMAEGLAECADALASLDEYIASEQEHIKDMPTFKP